MKYAGFWKRFVAAWVDVLVFLPLTVPVIWLSGLTRSTAIFSEVTMAALAWYYTLWFHARRGQTIGKMVAKIEVRRVNGEPIGWHEAFLRCSVDGGLSALGVLGSVIAISGMSDHDFAALSWEDREAHIRAAMPLALAWVHWALMIWGWGELLTLLSNKERRALHDFIAGTVVVQIAPKSKVTVPPTSHVAPPVHP